MLTNKDRNKVRKHMIDRYSLNDEHNKDRFPKLKTKKERAVAYMEDDGKKIASKYGNRYGRNLYREGDQLADRGSFCWNNPEAYDLIKKVYGKKKADECVEKDTVWETYKSLVSREYAGMVNDLHSGKDVMLKTSTSKTKKASTKKTSRWR